MFSGKTTRGPKREACLENQAHLKLTQARKCRTVSGDWLEIQLVPMYFQTWDSQATLQYIKRTHGENAKLKCPQHHTQAKKDQLLERQEVDGKVEAHGVHIRRKYEKLDEYTHTL